MILYLDRIGKTLRLTTAPSGAAALKTESLKVGDAVTVTVEVRREGVLENIPGLVEMVVPVKAGYADSDALLAVANDWTPAATGIYQAPLVLDDSAMRAAIADLPSLACVSELTLTDEDGGPVTTPTFKVALANDVWRGDEGTPSAINALLEFEDDAAKLAVATTPRIGQLVRITGEADRIEQFLGGDASEQTSWLVLQNTVDLTVTNYSGSDVTVNGVTCDTDETTNVGWVNPAAVSYIAPDGGTMNSQADDSFDCACASGTNFGTGGTFALPFATKSRSAVTLSIGGA
jgi:hypothetical protein